MGRGKIKGGRGEMMTKRIIFMKKVLFLAFVGIVFTGCTSHPISLLQGKKIELDENNNLIFNQIKNYDKSIKDELKLTLKDVQNLIKFIRKNYPSFDFEENGYVTDDYRNELLINDFNNSPQYAIIYLNGIPKMAGYSSVYSKFYPDENNELLGYFFSIDEEYSDCSGIEYLQSTRFVGPTRNNSLKIYKAKYADANEYYWRIYWGDISENEMKTMLESFLRQVRYTKVFENIDTEWFKDIYTGIERNQQIRDIVKW
jgi:hypothetical protein